MDSEGEVGDMRAGGVRVGLVAAGLVAALGTVLAVAPAAPAAAAGPTATVRAGGTALNVRGGPGTDHPVVRRLPHGARLHVDCRRAGERIAGTVRTTTVWNRLAAGGYVTDAYVAWRPARPTGRWCGGSARVHTGGGPLRVRTNTSTLRGPAGRLADGTRLAVHCQLGGERVAGAARTTAVWLRLDDRRYVSDAYVAWRPGRPDLPWCDQPRDPAPRAHRRFVDWAADHARASRREYRVPVSVTIAQAINESGWGRSSLTRQGNAYFGIKCFGTPGPVAAGCRPYRTRECRADECFASTGTFRVYRNAARSFTDHGRFLAVNPRYDRAFAHTGDPDRFAREIHRAGYATDPDYSDKLIALMRHHDLYRFDR